MGHVFMEHPEATMVLFFIAAFCVIFYIYTMENKVIALKKKLKRKNDKYQAQQNELNKPWIVKLSEHVLKTGV